MNLRDVLNNREISNLLSISTGLALEPLFSNLTRRDASKVIVPIDLSKYKYHIFNVWTLTRNIVEATGMVKDVINARHASNYVIEALQEELAVLSSMYEGTGTTPILFIPNYDKYYKEYISYSLQKKKLSIKNELDMLIFDVAVKTLNMNTPIVKARELVLTNYALITTHIALDFFNKVHVLESHTGHLIEEDMFTKKYKSVGKEDLSFLPWDKDLLIFLGDKNFLIGEASSVKKRFLRYARERRVSKLTTNNTIRDLIKKAKTNLD